MNKMLLVLLSFFVSVNLAFSKDNLTYGLGLSVLSTPSYLGSKNQELRVVPFPYIEYKSKYINIDKDKIYNEFYNKDRLKVEVSIRGMLPSKSEESARVGMEDLDLIIEVGPKFIYDIYSKNDMNIDFELPFRAAFSIGNSLEHQGFLGSFDLKYKNKLLNNYTFSFTTGLGFADKKFNNYYYEVNSQDVTSIRTEYHSKSGYSGWHNALALTKRDEHMWYGGFIKHYYLDGVVFKDSSLLETKNSLFYGLAFSYLF